MDYPDKNTAIIPVEDWLYFERYRDAAQKCGAQFEDMAALEGRAVDYIRENGSVSSASLPIEGRMRWHSVIHWSGDRARYASRRPRRAGADVLHRKTGDTP